MVFFFRKRNPNLKEKTKQILVFSNLVWICNTNLELSSELTAVFKKDKDILSNIKNITRLSLSLCIKRAFSSSPSISLTLSSTSLLWWLRWPWNIIGTSLSPFSKSSTQEFAALENKSSLISESWNKMEHYTFQKLAFLFFKEQNARKHL